MTNRDMNVLETARLLACRPETVRGWANRGLLPYYRTAGGHRRFKRDDILAILEARSQGAEVSSKRET